MNEYYGKIVRSFAGKNILVVGESTIDVELVGFCRQLAQEAPVPVVSIEHTTQAAGRAANTAANIAGLGAHAYLLSVVGDDQTGKPLCKLLINQGVDTTYVITEPGRETQTVQRVSGDGHLLVRFDIGSTAPISPETEATFIKHFRKLYPKMDAIVVSDYNYGVLTQGIVSELAKLQRTHQKPLIIDAKHISKYHDARPTVAKPNYHEALQELGITHPASGEARVDQLQAQAAKLLNMSGAHAVIVTLDVDGSVVLQRRKKFHRTYSQPFTHTKAIGAGDTFAAGLTLSLASRADLFDAANIAQYAAAAVIQKPGTAVCHQHELLQSFIATPKYIANWTHLGEFLTQQKHQGKRIVFTNGCFDILHSGHIEYLRQAKAQGDILVVGVNGDTSVTRLKGKTRPINTLADRIQVLAGLQSVDLITSFNENMPVRLLKIIQPHIYVKGGDYNRHNLPEAPVVEKLGGQVKIMPFIHNHSTTKLMQHIQSLTPSETKGSKNVQQPTLGTAY